MALNLGIGGVTRHACAALSDGQQVLGVCEQERITRVRGAGCDETDVPEAALGALLAGIGRTRDSIATCTIAENAAPSGPWSTVTMDHHEGHACAAYLTSAFESATILVCDEASPGVSIWKGDGGTVGPLSWPWRGPGFSDLYGDCARLLGFGADGGAQRFEALARMMAADPDERVPELFALDGSAINTAADWRSRAVQYVPSGPAGDVTARARLAAALQRQIAGAVVDLLKRIQNHAPAKHLCMGGGLFHHSSINTAVRNSGLFEQVFVPANPGNAGLSVGGAMKVARMAPQRVSAFMGPAYDPDDCKATLDNCKLRYDWMNEGGVIDAAVHHLQQGRLVGWFEGRMEWGPRALGARSILANPFSPYVLENLNHFLKRREPWRGYALSAPAAEVSTYFSGPTEAPFMECDYRPRDVSRFKSVLPSASAHVRVQTVTEDCPPGFRGLLEAFGKASGIPCLVNTSFNGFHEPIVCTPRDAVRVFYGSGLDVLVLDRFILTK